MGSAITARFAQGLVTEHGRQGWLVELDKALRRFGRCRHGRKIITLLRRMEELNSEAEVLNTVMREIAPAIAGPRAGHGEKWQRVARSIGCSGERCYSPARTVQPPPWFILDSAHCGRRVPRIRKPRQKIACAVWRTRFAGGRFDARFLPGPGPRRTQHLVIVIRCRIGRRTGSDRQPKLWLPAERPRTNL